MMTQLPLSGGAGPLARIASGDALPAFSCQVPTSLCIAFAPDAAQDSATLILHRQLPDLAATCLHWHAACHAADACDVGYQGHFSRLRAPRTTHNTVTCPRPILACCLPGPGCMGQCDRPCRGARSRGGGLLRGPRHCHISGRPVTRRHSALQWSASAIISLTDVHACSQQQASSAICTRSAGFDKYIFCLFAHRPDSSISGRRHGQARAAAPEGCLPKAMSWFCCRHVSCPCMAGKLLPRAHLLLSAAG